MAATPRTHGRAALPCLPSAANLGKSLLPGILRRTACDLADSGILPLAGHIPPGSCCAVPPTRPAMASAGKMGGEILPPVRVVCCLGAFITGPTQVVA